MEAETLTESISKSLELWTIITTYDVALVFLLLGLILNFSQKYFQSGMDDFSVKLSKENWAILFYLFRDYSLFMAYGMSLLLINPDMFADVKLPLPFFPVGTILLGMALVFRMGGNDAKHKKWFLGFLAAAAIVQYTGFVFVMEAVPSEWIDAGHASEVWSVLRGFRSNLNPQLSMWSFMLSFPVLMLITILMLWRGVAGQSGK